MPNSPTDIIDISTIPTATLTEAALAAARLYKTLHSTNYGSVRDSANQGLGELKTTVPHSLEEVLREISVRSRKADPVAQAFQDVVAPTAAEGICLSTYGPALIGNAYRVGGQWQDARTELVASGQMPDRSPFPVVKTPCARPGYLYC